MNLPPSLPLFVSLPSLSLFLLLSLFLCVQSSFIYSVRLSPFILMGGGTLGSAQQLLLVLNSEITPGIEPRLALSKASALLASCITHFGLKVLVPLIVTFLGTTWAFGIC